MFEVRTLLNPSLIGGVYVLVSPGALIPLVEQKVCIASTTRHLYSVIPSGRSVYSWVSSQLVPKEIVRRQLSQKMSIT